MKYKIDKEKCISCGVCTATCPNAIELESDGKAKVINHKELEKCGGENVCPMGAIEKISNEQEAK